MISTIPLIVYWEMHAQQQDERTIAPVRRGQQQENERPSFRDALQSAQSKIVQETIKRM